METQQICIRLISWEWTRQCLKVKGTKLQTGARGMFKLLWDLEKCKRWRGDIGCLMDITALQEIRWKGSGEIQKHSYLLYYSGGSRQGMHGTGFILNKRSRRAVIHFEPINNWICKICYKGKFSNITILSVYAPIEDAEGEWWMPFTRPFSRNVTSILKWSDDYCRKF